MNPKFEELPYRPCAGIMLANTEGKVFVGQRIDKAPEGDAWQMPQGGIDDGEEAEQAALRELVEETGISPGLVDVIARSRNEHFYDLPEELLGKIWKGKYRGQRQWWFLMRFKGVDGDINIDTDHPEFSRWQWVSPDRLPQLIVPFKKRLYESLVSEFGELI
ncbi:MAG TPA: RNA pyrophosphohydrolase [Sphingorhabdus lacus]|jgi:putative (di)nucleoside polyphosphate hydrolase|uniref:RNA pyrophosphohydrolase n=1 Tax=Sphingorhabdus lacus TaxID=392610 RepID=A0A6I6L670_9SPHN|nr:RNA pyrophosphohydrolase [Sphingorhabdus lacus]QGY80134.1 RNA pyrophosphohydrolase [Sphingorhabdus lacus]HNW17639.1 RNA pyrophosphohydrolase [Sphingorhabdus lacus]HPV67716.1 RNA pyrophosphohydrolase [Sphingorhabdus lacus]